ncbi:hypothetical protein LSAT2_002972 [Lamellibrachia satsuma]|nr:hypothetical protein LSAT2_002972 [Lamellibrachia satsuma]
MKVVLAVLVLVVLVSVTLAKPPKKPFDGIPDKRGRNGFRISQVSEEEIKFFMNAVIGVTRNASALMEDAVMRAPMAMGNEQKVQLKSIGRDMRMLHNVVHHLLTRGKLIVTRTFLVGFVGEKRCKDISPEDIKRQAFSGEERRVMCLIHNVGELIETFEDVSAELELAATTIARPTTCNQMREFDTTQGFDKDMLISFLSVDLNCLKGHMAFFLNFISELIAEVDSESIFCVLEHLT